MHELAVRVKIAILFAATEPCLRDAGQKYAASEVYLDAIDRES